MADWVDFSDELFGEGDGKIMRAAHIRQFIENIEFVKALPLEHTFSVHNPDNTVTSITGTTLQNLPEYKYELVMDTYGGDIIVVANVVASITTSNADARFALSINGARHHGLGATAYEIVERVNFQSQSFFTLIFLVEDLEPGQYTFNVMAAISANTLRIENFGRTGMWATEISYVEPS